MLDFNFASVNPPSFTSMTDTTASATTTTMTTPTASYHIDDSPPSSPMMSRETRCNNLKTGSWSTNEDSLLLHLVGQYGAQNWVAISSRLGYRTAKQCRERYHQHLKPTLNHKPITPDEANTIVRLVNTIGTRWATIARHLKNRSDNHVKNWWNGQRNRKKRQDRKKASPPSAHPHRAPQTPGPDPKGAATSGQEGRSPRSRGSLHVHSDFSPQMVPGSASSDSWSPGSGGSTDYELFSNIHSPGTFRVPAPQFRDQPKVPKSAGRLPSFNEAFGPLIERETLRHGRKHSLDDGSRDKTVMSSKLTSSYPPYGRR